MTPGMVELEVRSLNDLSRVIESLFMETKLQWWFRGHTSRSWDLLPSVRRGYTKEQEKYLSNQFYVRARTRHGSCPGNDDYSGWLALMQHYGLPTRLLDWSRSALVAAFFATENHRSHTHFSGEYQDSCIWAIAPGPLNSSQGFEPYLYPLNAGQLRDVIRPAIKGKDDTDTVVAAMAVESDPRMQVQQGAFTVHSSVQPLDKLKDAANWLRCIVIPKDSAGSIARELDILGFGLSDLFPDLHNLANDLKARIQPNCT